MFNQLCVLTLLSIEPMEQEAGRKQNLKKKSPEAEGRTQFSTNVPPPRSHWEVT